MTKQKQEVQGLTDLIAAPYNPRTIDAAALSGLKASLSKFGDLSGLVWNRRSGHLVAGHQRLRALREGHGESLRMEGGAVLTPSGESFPVRVVDWSEKTEKAANIAANNPHIAGTFTDDLQVLLASLRADLPDFEELRLDALIVPPSEPPRAPEEFPEYDEEIKTDHCCPKCGYRWSGKPE